MNMLHRCIAVVMVLLIAICVLLSGISPAWAAKLPGGVTSRVNKIDQYMTKVEQALANNRADHNNLERAQSTLDEIKKQYPDHANADEVRAAEERINKGVAAIDKLEKDQASAKAQQQRDEKTAEQIAEEWADRLSQYKADTKEGTKGNFGVPLSDPARIQALAPQYREAKTVYAEFQATGIDKDSHWKLRQAEYDIRIAIENYEGSMARLTEEAAAKMKEALGWQTEQKAKPEPLLMPKDRLQALREMVAGIRLILPADSDTVKALTVDLTALEKAFTEVEAIVLKKRKMKPELYKGADSATLKTLASAIVLKEDAKAKILRTHVVSTDWTTESVEEWTDTTKTARQQRVTKGITVQMVLTLADDCFLFTLFIHQDTIGGVKRPLTGHVMFKDKFLRENLPGAPPAGK